MAGVARTIAVIGATGATGKHVVDHLRARKVRVIAVGRNEAKLRDTHGTKEGVELRVADVADARSVQDALAGADAVVTATGYVMGSGLPPPYMDTATSVVAAMRHHSIKRLVFMGSSGVLQPADRPTCGFNAFLWVARYLFCAGTIIDNQASAFTDVVSKADDIDWVYVRPDTLENGPGGKDIVAGDMGVDLTLTAIDRIDVAAYMVDQVLDDAGTMVHTAKCIAPRA